jgi:hypothetical protein
MRTKSAALLACTIAAWGGLLGGPQQHAIAVEQNPESATHQSASPLPIGATETLGLSFAKPKNELLNEFDRQYEARLSHSRGAAHVRALRVYDLLPIGSVGAPLPPVLALFAADEGTPRSGAKRGASDDMLSDVVDRDSDITVRMKPWGDVLWAHDVNGADPAPLGSGTVREYFFLVFSDPASPSQESEYNAWYDHQHLPDVLRVPGFLAAQRFVTVSASKNSTLPKYLVIFVLRSKDLAATNEEIVRRLRAGITVRSSTMGTGLGAFFEPLAGSVAAAPQAR